MSYSRIILLVVLGLSIFTMITRKKTKTDGKFSRKEKRIVYVLCILNPIVAGAIFYYGWKKKLPIKAKKANKISFISLGIVILLYIIYGGFMLFNTLKLSMSMFSDPAIAIQALEKKLEKDPTNDDYLAAIGIVKYMNFTNTGANIVTGDAMIYIDKALSINPKNEKTLFYKIMILVGEGKKTEANTYYEQLSQINPDYSDLSLIKEKIDAIK